MLKIWQRPKVLFGAASLRLLCVYYLDYLSNIESLLDTYSLEEILELNDLTEADALLYLVKQGFLELPDPRPL